MAMETNKGYRKDAASESLRVVVHMPKDEADAIDGWGIPAGMPSRTSAVRFLLKNGLESVKAQDSRQIAG